MERIGTRLRVLAFLVLLMLAALTTRLWFLQVLATTEFTQQSVSNSVRFVHTDAQRGAIIDANGEPLVENQLSLEVRVSTEELFASGRAEEVGDRLSRLLRIDVSELRKALRSDQYFEYQPKPVAEFVDPRARAYIEEHPDLFPGVEVVETSVRQYPQGRTAAHIVGSLDYINEDEYGTRAFRDYAVTDLVGRTGLEAVYEKWLHGTKGQQKYIVNADGEVIRALGRIPAEDGYTVQLALDLETQRIAEEELEAGIDRARLQNDTDGNPLQATAGVVVILEPSDGGVEAMTSVPSFDPRWNVEGTTPEQEEYLRDDELTPMLNRATQGRYYPGSTFKAISGLAAVKAGFVDLNGYYPCPAEYVHPTDESGHSFDNWLHVDSPNMTFGGALEDSCDTWFYKFGSSFYSYWTEHQLSKDGELMQKLFREWGFGESTGIDLPLEDQGFIADAEWASDNPGIFFPGDGGVWQPGGNILSMIGSDYFQSTPLQLARAYMAIANRGHLCRPHLADRILDEDGKTVRRISGQCDQRVPGYTESELAYVHKALLRVPAYGTATCAFSGFPLSQIPIAGKTGTAENIPKQDTSWFAAIVGPFNDPDHVIVAMVEQGGFGSQTAAPIVRGIVERLYELEPTPAGCGATAGD